MVEECSLQFSGTRDTISHLRFPSSARPHAPASSRRGFLAVHSQNTAKNLRGTEPSSLRQPHLTRDNRIEIAPHIPPFSSLCSHQLLRPAPFPLESSSFPPHGFAKAPRTRPEARRHRFSPHPSSFSSDGLERSTQSFKISLRPVFTSPEQMREEVGMFGPHCSGDHQQNRERARFKHPSEFPGLLEEASILTDFYCLSFLNVSTVPSFSRERTKMN